MIRLADPHFGADELAAVEAVLTSGWLVQGTRVAEFEAAAAAAVGTREAVAVNSGTSALWLSLVALGVGAGDEVVTAALSYPATANAVELVGARPVFVDVRADDFNIDPALIEARMTARTKVVLPVHLFGAMADLDAVLAAAAGAHVVEDAACALGAARHVQGGWRAAGAVGVAGCFSFHPRKIVTMGEGGMITTDDPAIAACLRRLRNHGYTPRNSGGDFESVGGNYRLTEVQAALGVAQMRKLETLVARRRALARLYDHALGSCQWLRIPPRAEASRAVYQSYVVLLDPAVDRARVIARLLQRQVESTIPTYAVPLTAYYRGKYGYRAGDFPVAERVFHHGLALPLHAAMHDDDVALVVAALQEAVA
jgi:dTDP-4-amino-4,6-dideoxygalactose transaminase